MLCSGALHSGWSSCRRGGGLPDSWPARAISCQPAAAAPPTSAELECECEDDDDDGDECRCGSAAGLHSARCGELEGGGAPAPLAHLAAAATHTCCSLHAAALSASWTFLATTTKSSSPATWPASRQGWLACARAQGRVCSGAAGRQRTRTCKKRRTLRAQPAVKRPQPPAAAPPPPPAQVDVASCGGLSGVPDNGGCGLTRAQQILRAWRPSDD